MSRKDTSGSNNPVYGKTCYTNGIRNRFLSPGESIPPGFYEGSRTKGMKIINNGVNITRIEPDEPLPEGYSYGLIKGSCEGRVSVKKDGKHKTIDPSKLDYYLNLGWVRGQCQDSRIGEKIYNNGIYNKRVKPNETPPPGFVSGQINHYKKDKYKSSYEQEIKDFILSLGNYNILMNVRPLWLKFKSSSNVRSCKKELDLYLPDLNLAIEFNGL